MCRQCGEKDRRGSSKGRRQRRRRLLEIYGNGVVCPCVWCGQLLANTAGGILSAGGRRYRLERLEQDRLIPGGPYALYNLVPACAPCNKARTYREIELPEGCVFGPVDAQRRAVA